MYQQPSDQAKPPYNQHTATGFPVSVNNSTTPPFSTATSAATSADYHQQPPPPPKPLVDWSTGLCDCFSDCGNCCLTWCCPCVTFGRVAEIVDRGSTSCGASGALYTLICCVIGCGCIYSYFYRTKMRQQLALKGNGCTDFLIHCCCEPCALCQEYRELESRGFDMQIGWHGNVEQRSRGVAMVATAPTVEQGMSRY